MDNQLNNFSLYEQRSPTNEDLTIIFTPNEHIIKYEYIILKDNQEYRSITINSSSPTNIFLDRTGEYEIKVTTYDAYNRIEVYNSGKYIIDKDKPYIILNESEVDMSLGSEFSIMKGIRAYDKQDGDLVEFIRTNYDELDFTTVGVKKLVYTVSDTAGNVTTSTATS